MIKFECKDCGKEHERPFDYSGSVLGVYNFLSQEQKNINKTCSCKFDPAAMNFVSASTTRIDGSYYTIEILLQDGGKITHRLWSHLITEKAGIKRLPSFKKADAYLKKPDVVKWLQVHITEQDKRESHEAAHDEAKDSLRGLSTRQLEKAKDLIDKLKEK